MSQFKNLRNLLKEFFKKDPNFSWDAVWSKISSTPEFSKIIQDGDFKKDFLDSISAKLNGIFIKVNYRRLTLAEHTRALACAYLTLALQKRLLLPAAELCDLIDVQLDDSVLSDEIKGHILNYFDTVKTRYSLEDLQMCASLAKRKSQLRLHVKIQQQIIQMSMQSNDNPMPTRFARLKAALVVYAPFAVYYGVTVVIYTIIAFAAGGMLMSMLPAVICTLGVDAGAFFVGFVALLSATLFYVARQKLCDAKDSLAPYQDKLDVYNNHHRNPESMQVLRDFPESKLINGLLSDIPSNFFDVFLGDSYPAISLAEIQASEKILEFIKKDLSKRDYDLIKDYIKWIQDRRAAEASSGLDSTAGPASILPLYTASLEHAESKALTTEELPELKDSTLEEVAIPPPGSNQVSFFNTCE